MTVKFIRDFRGRATKEAFYPVGFVGDFSEDIEDRLVKNEKCAEFVKDAKPKKETKPEEVSEND